MTPQPRDLSTVRSEVRSILEATPAFRALPAPDRKSLANAMVRVGAFLADDAPGWLGEAQAEGGGEGQADAPQKDPVGDLKQRLAEKPGQVGQDFKAGAVREGVEQFGELVKKVDFPNFVSGLVNGVFNAVVKASMDQMKAYGELLAACAKTVDEFARDNVTDGAARDHVANRFPSTVQVDTSGGAARLRLREDADGGELERAYPGVAVDLEDDDAEAALMMAAKQQMARERQQLMATMVLLGINRIVITNGQINAKVVFDMRAEDSARRQATAQLHDEQQSATSAGAAAVTWAPWGAAGAYAHTSQSHVATVESAVDDTSESKAEVKAQLTGEVQLKFKSETFPLERMVSPGGLALLNARAEPAGGAARPAAPPAQAQPQAPPAAQPAQPAQSGGGAPR
jgi:hypothetical protein